MFNLQSLTSSAEMMKFGLGEDGYANAEIEPVPELDYEDNEVAVTLHKHQSVSMSEELISMGFQRLMMRYLERRRQTEGSVVSNTS